MSLGKTPNRAKYKADACEGGHVWLPPVFQAPRQCGFASDKCKRDVSSKPALVFVIHSCCDIRKASYHILWRDGQHTLTGHHKREMNQLDIHLEHDKIHSLIVAQCDQLLLEQGEYL